MRSSTAGHFARRSTGARTTGSSRRKPIVTSRYYLGSAGDGWEDAHGVARVDPRLERAEIADVLVVHVEIDEAVQSPVRRHDRLGEAGKARLQIGEQLSQRAAPGLQYREAGDPRAHHRGHLHLHRP